jgi:hypothetical protein
MEIEQFRQARHPLACRDHGAGTGDRREAEPFGNRVSGYLQKGIKDDKIVGTRVNRGSRFCRHLERLSVYHDDIAEEKSIFASADLFLPGWHRVCDGRREKICCRFSFIRQEVRI